MSRIITFIATLQGIDHVERCNSGQIILIIFRWAGKEGQVNKVSSEKN
jgi:hypothetical protein